MRHTDRPAWMPPAGACAAAVLWLVAIPASSGAVPTRHVTVERLAVAPPSAAPGDRITVRASVRNRSRSARRPRISLALQRGGRPARPRVIARKLLGRVPARRTVRTRLRAILPRGQAPGSYRVVACVRLARGAAKCKAAARPLQIIAGPVPVPPAKQAQPTPEPPPAAAPTPLPTPTPTLVAQPTPAPPRGAVFQTIDGFGTSSRVFEDPHVFDATGAPPPVSAQQRGAVLEALYGELGLTRVRPVQPETNGDPPVGIEVANDNADPFSADLSRFNFSGRRLDGHAVHVAAARGRGAGVAWMSPLNREAWMGTASSGDVAEYAEWLLAQVRRFKQQGAALDYVSVANEPSYTRNAMSGEFMRDVIKVLGPRLAAEGLLVPFVVADDVRASDGAQKAATILADPQARQYVGALATHLYDEPVSNVAAMRSLARTYELPLWMSEFSIGAMSTLGAGWSSKATPLGWAELMHELLTGYDVSAIDYLWGFRGAGGGEATLIRLDQGHTTYTGFTRLKVFYYFGQYSRFVRPGAQRVSASSGDARVKVSAFYRGNERVLVAINPATSVVSTTLSAPDLEGVAELEQTRTSATENWARPPAVTVSGPSVTVSLPPGSVTTLVGTKTG